MLPITLPTYMARRARFELAQHLKCPNGLANRPLQPNLGTSALLVLPQGVEPRVLLYKNRPQTVEDKEHMGGSKGIEPILKVPQTSVLPLHQQPHVVGRPGIEPGESKTTDLQSASLPSTEYRPIMVGAEGFEPSVFRV